MEKWINKETIYEGKILSLEKGTILLENGIVAEREIINHSNTVGIVPIINDSIIFVRQYRISVGKNVLEIPAGRINLNETPIEAANRELQEEIGYAAKSMQLVSVCYPSVSYTNEKMSVFIASGLFPSKATPDFDEQISIEFIPISEIKTKLINFDFEDARTIIGLQAYITKLFHN